MTLDIETIKESLSDKEIIGLVIPGAEYDEMLIELSAILSKSYNKILYISANKPYGLLVNKFKQTKADVDKFHFIDCITRRSKDVSSTKNCTYVFSPGALDELQRAIIDVLRKQEIDVALIDSPSSLLIYQEHMDILQFMDRLITIFTVANCKAIFPFQKDSMELLRRGIEMFTDKTVHLYVLT